MAESCHEKFDCHNTRVDYVEMPFSNDETWDIAKTALARPLLCYQDFEDAVFSYNKKFQDLWKRVGILSCVLYDRLYHKYHTNHTVILYRLYFIPNRG